ncbi:3-dehydrosphinganine reductase, partial [Blyttiomyces sp. JEL0837]
MSSLSTGVSLSILAVSLLIGLPLLATTRIITSFYISKTFHKGLLTSLKGKHILITGASKGLGLHLAIELASAGVHVTLLSRGSDVDSDGKSSLDRAVELVSSKAGKGVEVRSISVDASRYEDVISKIRSFFEKEKCNKFDWIIANAGGSYPGYLSDQIDSKDDVVNSMMKMNYFTAVNVIRAVMKFVKEKQPAETVEDG